MNFYQHNFKKTYIKAMLVILLILTSDIGMATRPYMYADSTLKSVSPFPVGGAVKIYLLRNSEIYRSTIIKQYSSITAENAMKFGALHRSKDVYKWVDADFIVDFAIRNNIRVHGHTLIWPSVNPAWVKNFKGSKAEWEELLKSHIQTVVRHFKGKVASWDVVNEVLNDNGTYKNSIWLQKLGEGYVGRCFQYAHEADPNALLFYNDYGQEYSTSRLNAVLKLVKDLKGKGIPIHGLGLQMHTVVRISDARIKKAIDGAASTGLKVHLSELEVAVNYQKPRSFILDTGLANLQAKKYGAIVKAYLSIPKSQQFGITTWNIGDGDSWKNSKVKDHDYPLLFDKNYNPKPAYYAFIKALKGE